MLALLLAAAAQAHSGSVPIRGQYDWSNLPEAAPGVWIVWTLHPSIVIGCASFVALYVALAGPLRERWNLAPEGPSKKEWAQFLTSIAIVFCALQGPLHELSDYYMFTAHMIQHLLITLIFPPLFLRGIPPWMWQPLMKHDWAVRLGKLWSWPPVAIGFATLSLYMWHVPSMYDWALRVHNVHIVEHLIFMTGAVVMWFPVHSRLESVPPLTPGYRMIYLFSLTIPMKALGAMITVSDYVLYQFYASQPRVVVTLDPLYDQRLGGLIMWLPGGLVFWFTIGYIFFTQFYAELNKERSNKNYQRPQLVPVEA